MKNTLTLIAVLIAYFAILEVTAETLVKLGVPMSIGAFIILIVMLSPFWIADKILN